MTYRQNSKTGYKAHIWRNNNQWLLRIRPFERKGFCEWKVVNIYNICMCVFFSFLFSRPQINSRDPKWADASLPPWVLVDGLRGLWYCYMVWVIHCELILLAVFTRNAFPQVSLVFWRACIWCYIYKGMGGNVSVPHKCASNSLGEVVWKSAEVLGPL